MIGRDEVRVFRSSCGALFVLTALLFLAHTLYAHTILPERVASHFDVQGRPDGWMGRDAFLVLQLVLLGVLGVPTAGIGVWLPRMPDALINLPNRDHWLAPERRAESLASIGRALLLYAAATFVMLALLMADTVHANLAGPEAARLEVFGEVLFGYLAFTALWVVWLVRRFARPPRA